MGDGSELHRYFYLLGHVEADGLALVVAEEEFSVGVGRRGPTGTGQGMMTAQFLEFVSGILSQNYVS